MNARERHHNARPAQPRPLHDLLLLLPRLCVETEQSTTGNNTAIFQPSIDWLGLDAGVVAAIERNASLTARAAAHGITAIGHLLVCSAPEIELRDISAKTVEAVGRVLAELGELAAVCEYLEATARRATQHLDESDFERVLPVGVTASRTLQPNRQKPMRLIAEAISTTHQRKFAPCQSYTQTHAPEYRHQHGCRYLSVHEALDVVPMSRGI